jgi:hypothetical protein
VWRQWAASGRGRGIVAARLARTLDISVNFAAPVDYPAVLGALIVLDWPVYRMLWVVVSRDAAEAKESAWYFFGRSCLRSLVRGEVWKQLSSGSKTGLLFVTIMVLLCAEYAAVARVIDVFVKR